MKITGLVTGRFGWIIHKIPKQTNTKQQIPMAHCFEVRKHRPYCWLAAALAQARTWRWHGRPEIDCKAGGMIHVFYFTTDCNDKPPTPLRRQRRARETQHSSPKVHIQHRLEIYLHSNLKNDSIDQSKIQSINQAIKYPKPQVSLSHSVIHNKALFIYTMHRFTPLLLIAFCPDGSTEHVSQ